MHNGRPMRIRISAKIFSIAVLIVLMMTIGSIISVTRVAGVREELEHLANNLMNLESATAALDQHSLEYELHVERLAAIYRQDLDTPEELAQVEKDIKDRSDRLHKEISDVHKLLEDAVSSGSVEPRFSDVYGLTLENATANFLSYEKHSQEYLAETKLGNTQRAQWIEKRLEEEEDEFDAILEQLRHQVEMEVQSAGQRSESHESALLYTSIGLTAGALFLGLLIAWFVTRNLVRPVYDLLEGTKAIEQGNLQTSVPIRSDDEIGTLTASFNKMATELQLKERIKETFGRFVDPRIVSDLIERPQDTVLEGERRIMTVFFSDIADFTSISEKLTPVALVQLINAYLSRMAVPIQEHRGVIDKFIGDAIMAFWGPPFTSPSEHANLAAETALAQMESLKTFRDTIAETLGVKDAFQDFRIRIGLATGDLVVGEMGSEQARNYTVMGDTVNLASRLEAMNKNYGTSIIVSAGTRQMLSESFITRKLDVIRVKGKTEPVAIHELVGRDTDLSSEHRLAIRRFEEALELYQKRQWPQALVALENLDESKAVVVLRERSKEFQKNPPPESWDGVWNYETK